MRLLQLMAACLVVFAASTSMAAQISGEYLESRSCDVFTGECFANAESTLAGKEAVMAWKVDKGSWNGVALDGLSAALVLNAEGTIGHTGVFECKSGKIRSVLLVDSKATPRQRNALVAFVRENAKKYTKHIVEIKSVPMTLKNDHLTGSASFTAGKIAEIKTRGIKKIDCVCTNERVFYQPLIKVENFSPAYALKMSYTDDTLNNKWTTIGLKSAFLATFRR
jgi:hypothetical protein